MLPTMISDRDIATADFNLLAGEKVQIEESNKYSPEQSQELWKASGLVTSAIYGNAGNDYRKCPNPDV